MATSTSQAAEQLESRLFLSSSTPQLTPVNHNTAANYVAAPGISTSTHFENADRKDATTALAQINQASDDATGDTMNGSLKHQSANGDGETESEREHAPATPAPPTQSSQNSQYDNAESDSAAHRTQSTSTSSVSVAPNNSQYSWIAPASETGGEEDTQTFNNVATTSFSEVVLASLNESQVDIVQVVRPQLRAGFGVSGESASADIACLVFNSRRLIDRMLAETPTTKTPPKTSQSSVSAIARGAAAIVEPLRDAAPAMEAAAGLLLNLSRPDALATFADAMAGFAHESAAVDAVLATAQSRSLPWIVTAAVLGADAVLLGHWYAARRNERRRLAAEHDRLPFSIRSI